MSRDRKKIVVAITGASGAVYGVSLVNFLSLQGHEIACILTKAAETVLRLETGLARSALAMPGVTLFGEEEITAPVASGSFLTDGMVIAPCSMRTLMAVATGQAGNLVQRAADVTLKERRRLILVPRETPLNRIHIENMLRAHDAGAVIMPAMPAFYSQAKEVIELVTGFAGRILDQLGVQNDLAPRWRGADPEKRDAP